MSLVVIVRKIPGGGPKINIDEGIQEAMLGSESNTKKYCQKVINFALSQENINSCQCEISLLCSLGIEYFEKEQKVAYGRSHGKSFGSAIYLALLSAYYQKPISNRVAATGFLGMGEKKGKIATFADREKQLKEKIQAVEQELAGVKTNASSQAQTIKRLEREISHLKTHEKKLQGQRENEQKSNSYQLIKGQEINLVPGTNLPITGLKEKVMACAEKAQDYQLEVPPAIKEKMKVYLTENAKELRDLLFADTHGLPIEHKMIQAYQGQKINLRQVCHDFALEQVQIQKEQLKKLGLFTDYNKHYITLNKEYEAEQIRVFGEMVKKNLVYQGFKPIYWSCGHETALAENEIEYYEKKDTSLYFKIKLVKTPDFLVAIKKTASYALVNHNNEYLIILENQIPLFEKLSKEKPKIEKILAGERLLGLTYSHPYQKDRKGYIVDGSDFIEEGEGTGIVHLAPAFGAEDFAVAKKEKLTIECPLEPNGLFNKKIVVSELIGKHYSEVNQYVITDLEKRNLIVKKEIISHSYPHDWRDKSVPIPVLYKNNEPILNPEIIDYVAKIVASSGSDCWFDGSILPLLQEKFPGLINEETVLGEDIMDVWLDSGVSHRCVFTKIYIT
ncbi:5909_t:CDS:2 [Entrophospora sp. SA101]|nr:3357_t:CDS:2 [Entrophospora sp. SA101]CAJ0835198.1 5909_t:CDS:2 [Entrophospora sp. SA101]